MRNSRRKSMDCSGFSTRAQRTWIWGGILVVITVLSYWPAIGGQFLWDDDDYVENNQTLRSWQGLQRMWLEPKSLPQYYPLVHTSFWLEYQVVGSDPRLYHCTNIVLHAINAILLWRLLNLLSVPYAWLVAICFALHPVHVESVAWITERKNVLSGFFYLLSATAFLRYNSVFEAASHRKQSQYAMALMFFVAAVLCKTVTATLPAVLLLIAWWKHGRLSQRELLPVIPMFAVGVPLALLTVWLEKYHVGAQGLEWDLSLTDRFLVAGRACCFYATKLLVPSGLAFVYPRWHIDSSELWQYLFPLGAILLIAILAINTSRWGRGPLAAVLFFGGTLFPALGFFNVLPHRYSFVADHFQYLASIGLLVLFGAAAHRLGMRIASSRRTILAGTLIGTLGLLTWNQCWIYSDREVLWLDTISKNPRAEIAYTNLGMIYLEEGRYSEALTAFEYSHELKPHDAVTHNNLGVVHGRLGANDQAVAYFRRALAIDPFHSDALNNLGAVLCDLGQYVESTELIEQAIQIRGNVPSYHLNLARTLQGQGRIEEARKQLAIAEQLDAK